MPKRTMQWAGLAAIAFVVLTLVTVFSSGEPPSADDAVGKIRGYLTDHRSALLVSNFLGLVAIPLVIWFGVALRDAVRGDRTANALGTASLAGLLITAPMAMAGGAVGSAVVYVDGLADKLGDDSVLIVYEAQTLLFAATAAGLTLFALAAALAIHRTRTLPLYTMWLAFLAAVGNVVALFSTLAPGASPLGLAGVLTFVLFVLVVGIVMAIGKVAPLADTTPARA
jgi:hypothetical protein